MENEHKHPEFLTRLDPHKKEDIDSLDGFMKFNTEKFWWCYYNKEDDKLYDQFKNLCMENAYQYLLELGHIDKDRNFLKAFS